MELTHVRTYFQRGLLALCMVWLWIVPDGYAQDSLYERIGAARLERIVEDYVATLSSDPRTRRPFGQSDLRRIARVLTEQLCDLTGGPCQYRGDSMRDVHAGHGITEREFLSGVELLREVLIRQGVGIRERNELLALLAPLKSEVVQP